MVSISDMTTSQYWHHLGIKMDKEKQKIPKQCIIGDTCFTSLANIGGNLFTRHPNNLNHLHRKSNNLMSVIIILGTNIHGGETVVVGRYPTFKLGTRKLVSKRIIRGTDGRRKGMRTQ